MNTKPLRYLGVPIDRTRSICTIWHSGQISRPPDFFSAAAGLGRLMAALMPAIEPEDVLRPSLSGESRLEVLDHDGSRLADFHADGSDTGELNLHVESVKALRVEGAILAVSGLFYRIYTTIPTWTFDDVNNGWVARMDDVTVASIWPAIEP